VNRKWLIAMGLCILQSKNPGDEGKKYDKDKQDKIR
jgi:hypothetical protein